MKVNFEYFCYINLQDVKFMKSVVKRTMDFGLLDLFYIYIYIHIYIYRERGKKISLFILL